MRDKRTKKDVCGEASQRSEIFNFTWKQPEFFQILLQPLTKVVYSTARIIFTFIVFLLSNRIKKKLTQNINATLNNTQHWVNISSS